MNKKVLSLLLGVIICTIVNASCSDCKKFTRNDGTTFVAESYGWANADSKKKDGVIYEANFGNVLLSIFFFETLVVPVYVTGWDLFEPVYYEE